MNEKIKQHYQNLLKKHGDSPESVQYSDKISQYKRFEILSQIDKNLNSVVDVGCGLAHLYDYLLSIGFKGNYLGLDFVEEFIEINIKNFHEHTNAQFKVFDVMKEPIDKGYDYAMLSGVFNNKSDNNEEFLLTTIHSMFEACNKGVAFNAMSTYVDYQDENLFYVNPLELFDYIKKNITKKVTLRHDYLVKQNSIPFEFCMYLYK